MAAQLKQKGNDLYKEGNYTEALEFYWQALQLDGLRDEDKAKIHNNRAACFLKLGECHKTVAEATECEFCLVLISTLC